MKTLDFVTNCFYHIYNRGVDGRDTFSEDRDYLRFVHSLYEFNDKQFALQHNRIFREELILRDIARQPLVNILCFCLMPNHFHIILQQKVDGGITKFMRKLGTGYTLYFNLKYKRNGVLFQSRFRSIMVETDEYLLHLSRYIHINPIEIIEPQWKQNGIKDWRRAKWFLKEYRWSSLRDYIGLKEFPSVIQKDFLQGYFKDSNKHREFIEQFLIKDMPLVQEIILED